MVVAVADAEHHLAILIRAPHLLPVHLAEAEHLVRLHLRVELPGGHRHGDVVDEQKPGNLVLHGLSLDRKAGRGCRGRRCRGGAMRAACAAKRAAARAA